MRSKAMAFLQKLTENDALPGLHIEPIAQAADPRVRTGRVDSFWRAVMFRVDQQGEAHYVIHGIFAHDEAIAIAQRVTLRVNPVNGLPQIEEVSATAASSPEPTAATSVEPPAVEPDRQPLLARLGHTSTELVQRLGIPETVAHEAFLALGEDEIQALAERHEGWVGYVLIDLATGESVERIVTRLELERPPSTGNEDTDLLQSLQRPAAATQFAFIDDDAELRRVIEEGDFGAWRVFLHPEQRRWVDRRFSGPARLTGGAGTGKTVVLVHRARALAGRNPGARIILTTFTTNLADSLRESLTALDPNITQTHVLGQPGVYIAGVDALAAAVLRAEGAAVPAAVRDVLGEDRSNPLGRLGSGRWESVLDATRAGLAPEIANETFLADEYALVVLPSRITSAADYLRVRRPGRGQPLDRGRRAAVWLLVEAYRAQNRVEGALDFAEAAAVAAAAVRNSTSTYADSVLVDEGQDLSPLHWQLLRALVAEGTDDLFIAEDAHQRIYGPRVVLGHYGIRVVGRSQRLRLNYRTTAQNLRYAIALLQGGDYVDLDEEPEGTDYRSARSGPSPLVVAADSMRSELDEIVRQVGHWVDVESADPGTVAVLVHDKFQRERVVTALSEGGVAARAVGRERPPRDKVLVMTMHRSKGMEFSRVLLAGAGSGRDAARQRVAGLGDAERREAELRARSLLYVAATRARDELVVVERSV